MAAQDFVMALDGRARKAQWFVRRYRQYLQSVSILDVGCDQAYLRNLIDSTSRYYGVGNDGIVDQVINLEVDLLPFETDSFDCVLCLDVLEHVENIHEMFDELCRVARAYVILSLPNAYSTFWDMLRAGEYSPNTPMKYHNLPTTTPEDRHKWFFCISEARRFVEYRAALCGMEIVDMNVDQFLSQGSGVKKWLRQLAHKVIVPANIPTEDIFGRTLWVVLKNASFDDSD